MKDDIDAPAHGTAERAVAATLSGDLSLRIHTASFAPGALCVYRRGRATKCDGNAMTSLADAFVTHRAALLRYLRARGAGEEAEDLLQEVWLKLETVSVSEIGDQVAYLYRMAHNHMLDRVRAQRRRAVRETTYHDVSSAPPGSHAASADQTLIARQRLAAVERALQDLGPKTNHIFRRYRLDNVPQQQLARELGVSLSAVEKQLQKAYRVVAAVQRAFAREDTEEPIAGGLNDAG